MDASAGDEARAISGLALLRSARAPGARDLWNKFVVIARDPCCILGQQQIRPPRQLLLLLLEVSCSRGRCRAGGFGGVRNLSLEMRWHSAHLLPEEGIIFRLGATTVQSRGGDASTDLTGANSISVAIFRKEAARAPLSFVQLLLHADFWNEPGRCVLCDYNCECARHRGRCILPKSQPMPSATKTAV
jgi:hypothetical protein